ncbi:hypothetical protein [Paenibacillus silvae]|uniref:hypothetical protein n=1 Tax=Paenibacillus silvae TaxID=1325358 RepID=UPI00142E45EC|nr:hypothetical protein [Paenibacillus silvae]
MIGQVDGYMVRWVVAGWWVGRSMVSRWWQGGGSGDEWLVGGSRAVDRGMNG